MGAHCHCPRASFTREPRASPPRRRAVGMLVRRHQHRPAAAHRAPLQLLPPMAPTESCRAFRWELHLSCWPSCCWHCKDVSRRRKPRQGRVPRRRPWPESGASHWPATRGSGASLAHLCLSTWTNHAFMEGLELGGRVTGKGSMHHCDLSRQLARLPEPHAGAGFTRHQRIICSL
jgi:hypothetical protein